MLLKRIFDNISESSSRDLKKSPMLFLTGPRQVGKTYSTSLMSPHYFNWDTKEVKDAYLENPYFFRSQKDWIIFDEIHKRSDWKKLLKGYYDSPQRDENFIVTGSGRFNLYQKGGDSLQGRYELFHMFPVSFDEFEGRVTPSVPRNFEEYVPDIKSSNDKPLREFGGFPIPLISQEMRKLNRWKDLYLERLIKEDVRDFSKVALLDKLELLARLLPERICSPLSLQSLSEDIECSRDSIKSWLTLFDKLYLGFMLPPYSKKIHRAVKREKKFYFYQWAFCEDKGALFENYLAVQLLTACTYWRDQGYGAYELYYVRDQDDREVDFLITKNLKPVALIEAKAGPCAWTKGLHFYTKLLKVPGYLVYPSGPTVKHENGFSLSSATFLKELIGR